MDSSSALGLIELAVVLSFALGWGVLELVCLHYDRKRRQAATQTDAASAEGPRHPERQ